MTTIHPDEKFGSSQDSGRQNINSLSNSYGVNTQKLRDAMEWSSNRLRPFRDRHADCVRFFAGNRYGHANDLDRMPVNMMRLAVDVWLRQLAAQTPKSLVLTRSPDLKTDSYELQIALDHLMQEINFGENLSETVRSAIFSMGIMKVGITTKYLAEGSSYLADAGQPYAEPVLFEDWIHDMNARRREEWDYCGNRYRIPYQMLMDNPDFDSKVKDSVKPEEEYGIGDELNDSYVKTYELSRSTASITKTEYIQHVELWDIWLPFDNLLITIPAQQGLEPLQIKEWEGPENGPYHLLGFSTVPGNVIPSAPAQHLFDLQDLISRLFNQLSRQAHRQKTLTIVGGHADADGTGERIMEGEDGQVIRSSHVDEVKEMKYGGVDQGNLAFVEILRGLFDYLGGNISSIGGLAQQAETLGQERLLAQSSSQLIQDMQSKVINFTTGVVKDLAWYMYTDPLIELPLVKRIPDYGDIPFVYGPESREGDFFAYNFQIQPYSLQDKGPQERLSTIMNLTSSIFLPLALRSLPHLA